MIVHHTTTVNIHRAADATVRHPRQQRRHLPRDEVGKEYHLKRKRTAASPTPVNRTIAKNGIRLAVFPLDCAVAAS